MLVHLMGRTQEDVQRVRLNLAPQQASVREVALEIGFTGTDKAQELHKVSLYSVVLPITGRHIVRNFKVRAKSVYLCRCRFSGMPTNTSS